MFRAILVALGSSVLFLSPGMAQSPLVVYGDGLVSGFEDWSWATHNLANTSPVHGGTRSISVSASAWQAVSFHHSSIDVSPYASLSFWAHGGTSGGQRLQVQGEYGSSSGPAYSLTTALTANTWRQYIIPLSSLGLQGRTDFHRFSIQLKDNGTSGTFYLDDIQLNGLPVPALVRVGVDAAQTTRTVDERHFGVNLAIWDDNYDPPNGAVTAGLLREVGCTVVRMPGGSLSDEYHWIFNKTLSNTWTWATSFADFMSVVTNTPAKAIVTVNYGTGSAREAAAWVAYANASPDLYGSTNDVQLGVDGFGVNWRSLGYWARLRSLTPQQNPDNAYDFLAVGRSAPFGIRYWEIGNECYGTWERDTNALPHHAFTYVHRATNYMALMKAADPTIEIGLVAAPGESSFDNGYRDHPVINPRNGSTNYGWTPILLKTLRDCGVRPEFLAHHVYPQWTDQNNPAGSPDNDVTLLQTTGNWASDAADLRRQIADYFGPSGTNIQLVVTENNSDAGAQGKQSTSLVNGVYYAESLARLLDTEFNGFVWWDFRNGPDTKGSFASHLYGWRTYGDLGMVNGPSTRHPAFYTAKLMQWLARPGENLKRTTSDYGLVTARAARRANGSLALLLVNKSLEADLATEVSLAGFTPGPIATLRSYGIPNDEAARTNGPAAAQDITVSTISNAAPTFVLTLPRMSCSVVSLAPGAPELQARPGVEAGSIVIQLKGQPEVPYVLQSSSDLTIWTSVSTNILTTDRLDVTNSISPGQRFWRAVWME